MNRWLLLFFLIVCFGNAYTYGQWATKFAPEATQKFTYGGNGGKFNGVVNVSYFIESENRRESVDDISNTVDLNKYRGPIRFVAEVSDLQLGLNASYEGVKNSNHPKVFYLEIIRLQPASHSELIVPIAPDTIKVSAKGGHFAKKQNDISFVIKPVNRKKKFLFRFKIRTRDGIYDRDWDGPIISKELTVLPKIPEIKNIKTTIAKAETTKQDRVSYERYKPRRQQEEVQNESETIEDKLWAKIGEDLISNNKKKLLQRCKIYKMNCDQHIFTECEYSEDVLFYMASLVEDVEKPAVIEEYKKQFPDGKYIDKVDGLIAKPKKAIIPIKENLAKLDYDEKILLVNRVEGGERPYHVSFFDYAINKEYAIKSIGFNSEAISLDLSELEISEGFYTVKVRDADDQVFVEKQGVYVQDTMQISNSIKLIIIIGLLGLVGFLFKKYIYF